MKQVVFPSRLSSLKQILFLLSCRAQKHMFMIQTILCSHLIKLPNQLMNNLLKSMRNLPNPCLWYWGMIIMQETLYFCWQSFSCGREREKDRVCQCTANACNSLHLSLSWTEPNNHTKPVKHIAEKVQIQKRIFSNPLDNPLLLLLNDHRIRYI